MQKDQECPPFEVISGIGTANPARQIGPAEQGTRLAIRVFQHSARLSLGEEEVRCRGRKLFDGIQRVRLPPGKG